MKKKSPKERENSSSSPENASHWITRPKDDSRLDWRNGAGSWLDEYVASVDHPHRRMIVEALKLFEPFSRVLEVGCNTGPNLVRIKEAYPEVDIAGIDVNADAIERAREILPGVFKVASGDKIPFPDHTFSVVIQDAVLMYSKDAIPSIDEMIRVGRGRIIIVDWYDKSLPGVIKDHHWARNYPAIMQSKGFTLIQERVFTKETWDSLNWQRNGMLFVFQAA